MPTMATAGAVAAAAVAMAAIWLRDPSAAAEAMNRGAARTAYDATISFFTIEVESYPYWVVALVAICAVWYKTFIGGKLNSTSVRDTEKKQQRINATLKHVLAYAREEEKKKEADRRAIESEHLLNLLWDDTLEVRTTTFGIDSKLNDECEALFKRVAAKELRKVIDRTRQALEARRTGDLSQFQCSEGESMSDVMKEFGEHESGDKLETAIDFTKKVKKDMGCDFVDLSLLQEAKGLAGEVRKDQSKNRKALMKLLRPALPTIVYLNVITLVRHVLMSKYHQIGLWAHAVETGAKGDVEGAYHILWTVWVGHMIIKVFEGLEQTYENQATTIFGQQVRSGVLSAMIRQDYEYFEKSPPGILQERLNRDSSELGENLIQFPQRMVARLTWVIANLVSNYSQTPTPLFLSAVCPVFGMITFQYFMFEKFRKREEQERKVTEAGVASTSEILREIKTVRQFAMEPEESSNYARGELAKHVMVKENHTSRVVLEKLSWMLFDSFLVVVMLLGIPYVVRGEMTVSQLVDMWVKFSFHINFCVREIIESVPKLGKLAVPMSRVCHLLQSTPKIEPSAQPFIDAHSQSQLQAVLAACSTESPGARKGEALSVASQDIEAFHSKMPPTKGAHLVALRTDDHRYIAAKDISKVQLDSLMYPVRAVFSSKLRPSRFKGHIEFRDVHFSYPADRRRKHLQGMSFTVSPGQKVALVGATGCGKSTCMYLLQRLADPDSGAILIDGVPIADYDVHFLRSRIVIVDQNIVLFNTTIRENITYGYPADDERVEQACKDAKAWEFISEKPDKLMSVISTGGSNLSGGQRQRLSIARAMVRQPDLILLDEATSALDNENEAKVQEALDKLARNGSALVIAHRLSTIMDSDKIVVVDKGAVVEEGTHSVLLAGKGNLPAANQAAPIPLTFEKSTSAGRTTGAPKAAAAPPRLEMERAVTAPYAPGGAEGQAGKPSYKRLWDTAMGEQESMSVDQMNKKIANMEKEVHVLKNKIEGMNKVKQSLLTLPTIPEKAADTSMNSAQSRPQLRRSVTPQTS